MVSILRSDIDQAREALPSPGRRPWERTGSVDVEVLASWAYGVQMVDRFEQAGLHAIERAASGFEPSALSACGVGQLMQINHLGARIDRSGGIVRDDCHPAALAVAACVGLCEQGRKVRHHALSGVRPSAWVSPEHKVRPTVWVKQGEVAQVEYQGPGRKGGYCQVIIAWDAKREAWGRDDYRQWWAGLHQLTWQLSRRALGFTVTGPAAPAEPWNDGSVKRAKASPIDLDEGEEAGGHPPRGSSQRPPPQ
ncbi:MAG: hypothetical protein ABIQ81_00115 [Novosphingobium sp.]